MKKFLCSALICFSFASCNEPNSVAANDNRGNSDSNEERIPALEKDILALKDAQQKIDTLVKSDFASCSESGATLDALVNKMCKVAQAATVENKVEMEAQLAKFSKSLNEKIAAISEDLALLNTSVTTVATALTALEAEVENVKASLAALETRMTTAEDAIKALQESLESLKSSLSGQMEAVSVGSENLAAGPLFENLLRRVDRTNLVAYVEDLSTAIAVGLKDVITTQKDSDVATIVQGGEMLKVGDLVQLSSCIGDKQVLSLSINGDFRVESVGPEAGGLTPFTFKMSRKATGTTKVGTTACTVLKVGSRGLSEIWKAEDGEDQAVRHTVWSSTAYNYIIKQHEKSWSVCYDLKDANASFEDLYKGSDSVLCK